LATDLLPARLKNIEIPLKRFILPRYFVTMRNCATTPLIFWLRALLLILPVKPSFGQTPELQLLTSGTKTSLRGLCVVNDNVVWVSGSHGMVGKSLNAGKNWNWMTVKGFEDKEFRDIEAFDGNTAIIMSVGEPGYILKTNDGGNTWKVVYENKSHGMFLDAMDFSDVAHGIVVGDPINNRVFLARTADNGNTWTEILPDTRRPRVDSGEAFFAASGSNIRLFRDSSYFIVSGGLRSRLIRGSRLMSLPIVQGKETTGANSIDIYDGGDPKRAGRKMIIVGGDFQDPASTNKNCFYTNNGGKTWKTPRTPPHGYRSCVEYLSPKDIVCCGINGVDYSSDGGRNWILVSKQGFNACRIARNGSAFFLAGNDGKIAKLSWD
jgi:photosystem II stability/assembly factor-like uncharacterized protein